MSFYNEQGEPTIQILDHGVVISNDPSSINFTGAGVTVSILGQDITVDIPGGGAGGGISGIGTTTHLPIINTVDGSNNILTLADSPVKLVDQIPETYLTGNVGDIAIQNDGNVWSKESGSGNTGWIPLIKSDNPQSLVPVTSLNIIDFADIEPTSPTDYDNYIDTTDWSGNGVNSVVYKETGFWNLYGTVSDFMAFRAIVANKGNLVYHSNGFVWNPGAITIAPGTSTRASIMGSDGYGNLVDAYDAYLYTPTVGDGGAIGFFFGVKNKQFSITDSLDELTANIVTLRTDNVVGQYKQQLPNAAGTFVFKVNGTAPDAAGNVSISAGIGGSGIANEIAYFTGTSTIGSLTTATYPSLTELSYVKGVTSAIQTQLNTKLQNNLGISGGTTYISGTGATDKTIFQTTSGNQTAAVSNLYTFKSGNNGANELARFGDGLGSTIGEFSAWAAGQSSNTTHMWRAGTNFTYLNAGTDLRLQVGAASYINMLSGAGTVAIVRPTTITPPASTGAPNNGFLYTSPAHTALTASTEWISENHNLSATIQYATGALTTHRGAWYQGQTISFVGASTLTNAYTVQIDAPTAGTNATITNPYALFINSSYWKYGSGTTGLRFRDNTSSGLFAAAYSTNVTPSNTNHFWRHNGVTTVINATSAGNLQLQIDGAAIFIVASGGTTYADAKNITFNTTTGTKIGTATTEKLSFWNATPIVQPANTVAIDTLLVNTGLRASGGNANFDTAIVNSLPMRLKGYTVAGLPAGVQGDTAYVTDALAPVWGAAVAGGGAVVIPVFYNGANWIVD